MTFEDDPCAYVTEAISIALLAYWNSQLRTHYIVINVYLSDVMYYQLQRQLLRDHPQVDLFKQPRHVNGANIYQVKLDQPFCKVHIEEVTK